MNLPIEIVQAWHNALNRGDVEAMMAWVHEEVVLVGPRGIASGAAVVREWFGRANVRLHPLAFYANGQNVVAEELGEWLDADTGKVVGSQTVATHFTVEDERITHIARYDAIATALSEAGLTTVDQITSARPE